MHREGEPIQGIEFEDSPENEVEKSVLIIKPDALELGTEEEILII